MLTSIKKLNVINFSFTRELYTILHNTEENQINRFTKLNKNFNKIISLQRELFKLQYGTLEQIGYYLIDLIRNKININIEIIDNHTLLEFIICKILILEVQYTINIEEWINKVSITNKQNMEDLKEALIITSENISHFNIIKLVEILDFFYLPDRYDILKNISDRLVIYYDHQISTEFNSDLYRIAIGSLDTLKDYIVKEFKIILNTNHELQNLEILRHPIFTKDNFIESFLETASFKSDVELERVIKTFEPSISNTDLNEIYDRLLKLSDSVILLGNNKLLVDFQLFTKFLDKKLGKNN